jgi:Mg/Co/Ni transporter MgtE
LSDIDESELPRDVRDDFSNLCRAMQRERPLSRGEDAVRATVRKMSNEEADRLATSVVKMFCTVSRTWTSAAVLRNVSSSQAPSPAASSPTGEVVQLFAAAEG